MRIGLISGEYPPLQGGVGAYTHILGLVLADAGHEVYVLAGPTAREDDHRLTLDTVSGWGFSCWKAVEGWATRRNLDVVNLQYQTAAFGMSPWIYFIPERVHAVPVAVTFHDLRFPYLFPKAGPLRPWIVRRLAQSAAGAIATNPEDFAALRGLPYTALIPIGSNIQTVAPSTDSAATRQHHSIGPREPLVLNFGLINRSKGLDDLIEALATLHSQGVPAKLLLVGSAGSSDPSNQAYEVELRQRVATAGLTEAVTITGFLPETKVHAVLKVADIVALPFQDGASMRRGSLMAALAAGCPIVTTTPVVPTPGFEDGVSMRLVPPGDAHALGEALLQLLQDTDLRAQLSAGALTLSRHFEWPAIAASVADFLQQRVEVGRR